MSLHRYLYGEANPINKLDPSGRFTLLELTVAVTIAVTLVGLAYWRYSVGHVTLWIDFYGWSYAAGFDLSNVKYADGQLPDKGTIEDQIVTITQSQFVRALITVKNGNGLFGETVTYTPRGNPPPKDASGRITHIQWGIESPPFGGRINLQVYTEPEVQKFLNEQSFPTMLANITMHEAGHAFGLREPNKGHSTDPDDVMYSSVAAGKVVSLKEAVESLAKPRTFSQAEIETIKQYLGK